MEVIILAGGLGTRLRSVVSQIPKCMAPVAGKPFLWYLLNYLKRYNVSKVILSVGYLREVIFRWIDTIKEDFPFSIEYAIEEEPLGTGGGIRLAMEKVSSGEAIILNGDTFFDIELTKLLESHHNYQESFLTIALKPMDNFDRYGTVDVSPEGKVLSFNEKKPCNRGYVNGGIYILSKKGEFFKDLPQKFSFETEVLKKRCGTDGCLFADVYDAYFIDIGIPEDYKRADTEFKNIIF